MFKSEKRRPRINWKIMELGVVLGILVVIGTGFSPVWTQTTAPGHTGEGIFISADGRKVIAVSSEAHPVFSSDYGNTWATNTAVMPHYIFNDIAGSADGTKLVGIFFSNPDYIYVSADSGFTWTQTLSQMANWRAVVSSADGTQLAAVIANSSIYTSTDSGQSWHLRTAPTKAWTAMASSADGTRLWLTVSDGEIFTSTNSGTNWFGITAPMVNWHSIACSADGNRLLAAGGSVYVSTNAGGNWTPTSVTGNLAASSADGTKLAVAGGLIYTSGDSGNTWQTNTAPSGWTSLAASADGCTVASGAQGGIIWMGRATPSPQLNLAPTNGALACSWILPSTNFVLQQNLDLTTANWTAVTNVPVLNLTNLQQQISLAPSNNVGFYRLITQ